MSATEELRRLLDERGVKWWPMRNNGYYEDRDTEFVANGKKHTAHEWGDGLAVYNLTPEQAIAATLGNELESMRVFDSMETALAIAEKEVEIEELKRENAELCSENAELAHRRAELEATMLGGGECKLTLDGTDGNFGCSECLENIPPLASFCPNCGAKVVKR